MPQYSLTGSPLDAAVPGQFYDPADMQRRRAAEVATNAALSNPNIPPNKGVGTTMEGLAYDYEGLLRSVAMKYGLDAAKRLVEMLPNAKGQRGAACGASAAPTGCASSGTTEKEE